MCESTPDICTNGEEKRIIPCFGHFSAHTFFLVISFTEQICIETFSSEGYICRETPDLSNSLVVKGVMGDPGFLSDFLQTFIEQQLVS